MGTLPGLFLTNISFISIRININILKTFKVLKEKPKNVRKITLREKTVQGQGRAPEKKVFFKNIDYLGVENMVTLSVFF